MVRILAALLLLAPAAETPTCNIPVYRYALERWPAAPYDVVAVHRGPLTDEQSAALNVLRQVRANLEVDRVDVAEPVPARRRALLDRLKIDAPALVALYPGTSTEAWRGALTPEAARGLVESPARREISKRLLEGQSGVWVLLESGERGKDDAAEALLAKELRGLEQSLKLPPHHPDDPPLLSDVPVAVKFSLLRLPRAEPSEQALVSMLLKSDTGLHGAIAFPVFGRGRALWAMAGAGLNADNILEAGSFLIGACSCEAKELNPGVDLLFTADWESGMAAAPARAPLPAPVLRPRPPEASSPAPRSTGSGAALWIALLIAGFFVAVTGRRVLAASKEKTS